MLPCPLFYHVLEKMQEENEKNLKFFYFPLPPLSLCCFFPKSGPVLVLTLVIAAHNLVPTQRRELFVTLPPSSTACRLPTIRKRHMIPSISFFGAISYIAGKFQIYAKRLCQIRNRTVVFISIPTTADHTVNLVKSGKYCIFI